MKKITLTIILFISLHAYASQVFSNLLGECGDSTKGQFDCDSDSIRVTYGKTELNNNGWIKQDASPSDIFVNGPGLTLFPGVGDYKLVQVTGLVKIYNSLFFQGHPPVSCFTSGHVFDVVLTATDASNNLVTLKNYPVSIADMFRIGEWAYVCTFNGMTSAADLEFPFMIDIPGNQYKNYKIQINNLTLNRFSDYDAPVAGEIRDFGLFLMSSRTWYLQLVGIR